jgi:voltage-gated potassium channel
MFIPFGHPDALRPRPSSPRPLWRRRLLIPLAVFAGFLLVASVGYWVIEPKYTPLDAVYMTVITIATVGYEEVGGGLSSAGRGWSIFVIIVGMVIVAVTLSGVVAVVVEGRLRETLGRQAVKDRIAKLTGHVIVCGYGRTGSLVAEQLKLAGRVLVVVDVLSESAAAAEEAGLLCVLGDAQEEGTLQAAGVERAESLVATLGEDAGNAFVTLSARGLNPQLRIMARAQQPSSEGKLRKAGATTVICPQVIGAGRMAQVILRPVVVDFVEMAQTGDGLEVEELRLGADSHLVGKTLRELRLPARIGVHVVAMQRADGSRMFRPTADVRLAAGDTLILIGQLGAADAVASLAPEGDAPADEEPNASASGGARVT